MKTKERMATKEKELIGKQIKNILSRNQRWLAKQIGMRESLLSEKINDVKEWKQDELDKINKVLKTSFKL